MKASWTDPAHFLVPKEVDEIPMFAFAGFTCLKTVAFEEGSKLNKISQGAFYGTGLTAFTVPKTVTEIGSYCFCHAHDLRTITFEPESQLKIIGEHLAHGTALVKLTLPKSVEEIGRSLFHAVLSFSELRFEEGTCIKTVAWVGGFSWTDPHCLVIPKDVTRLPVGAFSNIKSLHEVSFEKGSRFRKLGCSAFFMAGVKSFTFPESIETIESNCLSFCNSLSSLTFEGANIKTIEPAAFQHSPISTVTVPKGVDESVMSLLFTALNPNKVKIVYMESHETIPETVSSEPDNLGCTTPEQDEESSKEKGSLSDILLDINEYKQGKSLGNGS